MHLFLRGIVTPLALFSPAMHAQDTGTPTPSPASAPQVVARFEAGVEYTNRGLDVRQLSDGSYTSPPGRALGPAITLNLSRNVAIDALLSQSPQSQEPAMDYPDGSVAGGHSLELLAGPRISVRGGRLGVFLAARGGFLNWSRVLQDESYTGATATGVTATLRYGAGYYPVVEAAAGMEYAVTPSVHLRGDIGDQFTEYHTQSAEIFDQTYGKNYLWPSNGTAFLRAGVFIGVGILQAARWRRMKLCRATDSSINRTSFCLP